MVKMMTLRTLLAAGVNYTINKIKFNELHPEFVETWKIKETIMWENITNKIDTQKDPKVFWRDANRM